MRRNTKQSRGWRVACCLCGLVGLSGCFASNRSQGAASGGGQVEHGQVAFDVSADGKHVVFSSADADLYLLNLTTFAVTQLTKTELQETTPAFSPDGKNVAYSAGSGGSSSSHIYALALADKHVTQITSDTTSRDSMPSYAKDGSRLVFARAHRIRPYSMGGWTADQYDACTVSSRGGAPRRITKANYYQQSRPQFLSAKALVYGATPAYPDTTGYLFAADIATGRTKSLTPKANPTTDYNALGSDPDVSPDGKKIVFISDRIQSYAYDLFLMNANGTKPVPLNVTKKIRYNQHPVFLPDGKTIFFLAGTSSNANSRPVFSLWQVSTNGSSLRQVAGSALFTTPLTWKQGT